MSIDQPTGGPQPRILDLLADDPQAAVDENVGKRLDTILAAAAAPAPPSGLHARTVTALHRELGRRAARAYRVRIAKGLLTAAAASVAVLGYDAYVLRFVYAILHDALPSTLATYLVVSHMASLALLVAGTYAAVPLLAELTGPPRPTGGPIGASR